MESSQTGPNKAIIGIIVVALIAIAATTVIIATSSKDTTDNSQAVSSTSSTATSTSINSATSFKDGTYTATGSYQTPGGEESIGVTVTLSGNTISDASVTQNAHDGEAEEFQNSFASGFKSQVVGKKITDVSLTRVAGSSLTSIGFNSALEDIENQAKA